MHIAMAAVVPVVPPQPFESVLSEFLSATRTFLMRRDYYNVKWNSKGYYAEDQLDLDQTYKAAEKCGNLLKAHATFIQKKNDLRARVQAIVDADADAAAAAAAPASTKHMDNEVKTRELMLQHPSYFGGKGHIIKFKGSQITKPSERLLFYYCAFEAADFTKQEALMWRVFDLLYVE
jgi:hypothetical protein